MDTSITIIGLDSSTSTSVLSLPATLAGRWRFTCNASIQVPGDPLISYLQTAEVTVKGKIVFLGRHFNYYIFLS